jgi:nicotinate-nucleotide adenylyltransferase
MRRIGLLGGSFNPAHGGHRHISLIALKRLRLDELWWLVSPQNPLKPTAGMAPLAERVARARGVARHPRIRVTDIETRLRTRYTADTLAALVRRFPRCRFVWLMGADNLAQIHRWDRWTRIFSLMPIAVFGRPAYSLAALASKAARRYRGCRQPAANAGVLGDAGAPAWVFLPGVLHHGSATAIRNRRASAERLVRRPVAPAGNRFT